MGQNFARCGYEILHGKKPTAAMKEIIEKHFRESVLYEMFTKALETTGKDTVSAIEEMGQGCDVTDAFP